MKFTRYRWGMFIIALLVATIGFALVTIGAASTPPTVTISSTPPDTGGNIFLSAKMANPPNTGEINQYRVCFVLNEFNGDVIENVETCQYAIAEKLLYNQPAALTPGVYRFSAEIRRSDGDKDKVVARDGLTVTIR